MSKVPLPTTTDAKLDEIIEHLRRLDERDKIRMWGGIVRSLIAIIPIIIFLWSAWYFVAHGPELMKMIADQAASSAAQYTKDQGNGLLDSIMQKYQTPTTKK